MYTALRIAEDRTVYALDPRRFSADIAAGNDDDAIREKAERATEAYCAAMYTAESYLDDRAQRLAESCRGLLEAMIGHAKGWSRHGVIDTAEARQMADLKRLEILSELSPKLRSDRNSLLKQLIDTETLAAR